jgi:hypothetical protein
MGRKPKSASVVSTLHQEIVKIMVSTILKAFNPGRRVALLFNEQCSS